MTVGPPTVGKTTLKKELIDTEIFYKARRNQRRPCSSPVAERIKTIQIYLDNEREGQLPLTVLIGNEDRCSWKVLSLDEEVIGCLKKLSVTKNKDIAQVSWRKYLFILTSAVVYFGYVIAMMYEEPSETKQGIKSLL